MKSKVILRTKQSLLDTPLSFGMPGLFVAKKTTYYLTFYVKTLFDMNQATQFQIAALYICIKLSDVKDVKKKDFLLYYHFIYFIHTYSVIQLVLIKITKLKLNFISHDCEIVTPIKRFGSQTTIRVLLSVHQVPVKLQYISQI